MLHFNTLTTDPVCTLSTHGIGNKDKEIDKETDRNKSEREKDRGRCYKINILL